MAASERSFKLRSNAEFRAVLKRGRSFGNDLAVLYVLRSDLQSPRFGVSVPRRFGTAVVRNRVRRRFWEAYRAQAQRLGAPRDLVLIPRMGARDKDFRQLEAGLEQLLLRAGLLQGGDAR